MLIIEYLSHFYYSFVPYKLLYKKKKCCVSVLCICHIIKLRQVLLYRVFNNIRIPHDFHNNPKIKDYVYPIRGQIDSIYNAFVWRHCRTKTCTFLVCLKFPCFKFIWNFNSVLVLCWILRGLLFKVIFIYDIILSYLIVLESIKQEWCMLLAVFIAVRFYTTRVPK